MEYIDEGRTMIFYDLSKIGYESPMYDYIMTLDWMRPRTVRHGVTVIAVHGGPDDCGRACNYVRLTVKGARGHDKPSEGTDVKAILDGLLRKLKRDSGIRDLGGKKKAGHDFNQKSKS